MVADEATQGIDPKGLEEVLESTFDSLGDREKTLTTLTVCGAGFDKPAVKATGPWTDVCGTPNKVISGFHL